MSYASKKWTENYLGQTLKTAKEQGLLGSGGGGLGDTTPIGTIIPFMGNEAPKNYLVCDGTEYNISKYLDLATFIKDQFGSFNFFGGNGATTFAVPDLRGEFLRGSGTNNHTSQGSGEDVGEHQDATEHIVDFTNPSAKWLGGFYNTTAAISTQKRDSAIGSSTGIVMATGDINTQSWAQGQPMYYTSRPTNTSVLYCIKYTKAGTSEVGIGYDNYSEDEVCVGKWIDGKPLYRKIIKNIVLSNVDVSIPLRNYNINNVEQITFVDAFNVYGLHSGYYHDANNLITIHAESGLKYNDPKVTFYCPIQYNNGPYTLILEYTKSTDEPNSFTPDMVYNGMIDASEATDDDVKEVFS